MPSSSHGISGLLPAEIGLDNARIVHHLLRRAFRDDAAEIDGDDAADELHLTPSAVSRHIRSLEQALGVELFERGFRQVQLTEKAMPYARRLTDAFNIIGDATDEVSATGSGRRRRQKRVTLSINAAFMNLWLADRLPKFRASHPECELEVSIHYDPKAVQPAGGGTPSVTERVVEQGRGRVIVRQQVGGVIVFGGNAPQDLMRSDSSESTAFGLQVFDKDGKPLKASITRSVRKFDQSGIVTDTIKLKVKDGEPSKVSFTGSQSRVVEVPFRLTDVAVTVGTSPESGGQR